MPCANPSHGWRGRQVAQVPLHVRCTAFNRREDGAIGRRSMRRSGGSSVTAITQPSAAMTTDRAIPRPGSSAAWVDGHPTVGRVRSASSSTASGERTLAWDVRRIKPLQQMIRGVTPLPMAMIQATQHKASRTPAQNRRSPAYGSRRPETESLYQSDMKRSVP